MADLSRPVHLVVTDEARKDREPGRVRGSPGLRAPAVLLQVPRRAGAAAPLARGGVPLELVELVENPVVGVEDEHVPVAADVRVARLAPLDPVDLRLRLVGDRVEGSPLHRREVDTVALIPVLERDRLLRLAARDGAERDAVDPDGAGIAAEVRMERDVADPGDERRGPRIDRSAGDVEVPPVRGGEERQRRRQGATEGGGDSRHRHDEAERGGEEKGEPEPGFPSSPPRRRVRVHSSTFLKSLLRRQTRSRTCAPGTRPSARASRRDSGRTCRRRSRS